MFSVSSDRTNAACKTQPNMSMVTLHNPTHQQSQCSGTTQHMSTGTVILHNPTCQVTVILHNPAHVNSDPAQPNMSTVTVILHNPAHVNIVILHNPPQHVNSHCDFTQPQKHVNSHNDPSQPNRSTVTMILHNPTGQQSQ